MLDVFRKRGVMSIVYGGLMGAVIVVFIIQFRPGSGSSMAGLSKKCVAKVRGQCVDEKIWKAQRYLLRGPYEGSPQVNYNKMAMDSLVERTLLEQEASRLGIRVTEDDVMHEIIRDKVYIHLPVAMRAQGRQLGINEQGFRWTQFGTKEKPFDQQLFEKIVRQTTDQSTGEFIEQQELEILATRVLDLVAERVRVSEAEVWDQYVADKSTSTIRYARFVPSYFGKYFAPLDAASIDKWAGEHAADVDAKEKTLPPDQEKRLLHPRAIVVEIPKDATPEKKEEAKKKAEDLLAKVRAGEDFAKLAKDNSTDILTKDKGGDLDWVTGYDQGPEMKEALGKLKVGDSALVEAPDAFRVVQLIGRYDGKAATAYPLYLQAKGDEIAKQVADKVNEALKGKVPVTLDDALKAKVEEAKKTGKSEADATTQVLDDEARARFTKAVDDVLASIAPKVEEKKDEKKDEKKEQKKDDKDAKPPEPPPPPAWQTDQDKPRVEDSTPFNGVGSPVIGLMDQQTIVDTAAKLTKEAPLSAPTKASDDWFVILLKDRHEATKDEFAKDREQYLGAMLDKKREDAIVNYVTALRDSLGKDLFVEPRYVSDDKKAVPGEQAPPPPEDEP
jgi:parvulin-like peptidyl-prolyl isomerase